MPKRDWGNRFDQLGFLYPPALMENIWQLGLKEKEGVLCKILTIFEKILARKPSKKVFLKN